MLEEAGVVAIGADFLCLVGCWQDGEGGVVESCCLLEFVSSEKESCMVNCLNAGVSDCRTSEETELCRNVGGDLDWFCCFFFLGLDFWMLLLIVVFFCFCWQGGEKDSPKWALASAGRQPGAQAVPS